MVFSKMRLLWLCSLINIVALYFCVVSSVIVFDLFFNIIYFIIFMSASIVFTIVAVGYVKKCNSMVYGKQNSAVNKAPKKKMSIRLYIGMLLLFNVIISTSNKIESLNFDFTQYEPTVQLTILLISLLIVTIAVMSRLYEYLILWGCITIPYLAYILLNNIGITLVIYIVTLIIGILCFERALKKYSIK